MTALREVTGFVEGLYPASTAEAWDKVGLILGDPGATVSRILLAVDVSPQVVQQAVIGEYDLLLTHHPLLLRGTSFLPEDQPKGKMVADLIRARCALFNAHTNADVAHFGVAEALAKLIGVENSVPLVKKDSSDGHTHAGASDIGLGRVGTVQPQTLENFAALVASRLPTGPTGLLIGGDLQAEVRTVAVSGGAGDSLLGAARASGADVFLTADLRHHPASEHLDGGVPALLCGSHWATEWPWLPVLADLLSERFPGLAVSVSKICTEPWAAYLPTEGLL